MVHTCGKLNAIRGRWSSIVVNCLVVIYGDLETFWYWTTILRRPFEN